MVFNGEGCATIVFIQWREYDEEGKEMGKKRV